MKRTLIIAALAASVALPMSAHAVNVPVLVAGFQYVPSGGATVDPLNFTGGAGSVAAPVGTPVRRGDVLQFVNADPVPHTVTFMSGPRSWTSLGLAGPGAQAILTISSAFPAGNYVYRCAIHLGMRGTFTVVG